MYMTIYRQFVRAVSFIWIIICRQPNVKNTKYHAGSELIIWGVQKLSACMGNAQTKIEITVDPLPVPWPATRTLTRYPYLVLSVPVPWPTTRTLTRYPYLDPLPVPWPTTRTLTHYPYLDPLPVPWPATRSLTHCPYLDPLPVPWPATRTLYSRFPSPSLVVPASVFFFYCEILRNVAKFFSYFSRLPLPWVFRLPPSFLPPPLHFQPPLLPSSRPLSLSTVYLFFSFVSSRSGFSLVPFG